METNTTITVTYDCPFRNLCSDNEAKCATCANNPKRSYYRPVEPYYPIYPIYPYPYPYYPYYPPYQIWYTTSGISIESHYQSI